MTISKLHLKFQLNTAINKNIFIKKNVLNPGVHTSCYKNTIKSWWIKMLWPPSEVRRFDLHMITGFLRVTKCCRWPSNCPTLIPKIRQYNQNWTGLKIQSRIIPREVFKTIIREHPSPQLLTRSCFPESSPFLSPTQVTHTRTQSWFLCSSYTHLFSPSWNGLSPGKTSMHQIRLGLPISLPDPSNLTKSYISSEKLSWGEV